MSKSGELRMLKYGRRIDAPINYHHRTGDSEGSAGSMLDFYAQAESAEEIYFGNEDELARERFVKGFKIYLKKVFTAQEREFLQRLLAGKESAYKIGKSLGVEHFAFLQSIQLKAYKNVKPLAKLAKMTGWSGAESFTETIYQRLEQLNAGFSINEIIEKNRKIEKLRESKKAWRQAHREEECERIRAYRATHREEIREAKKAWRQAHREEECERFRAYYATHREEIRERIRAYRAAHREEKRERSRAYNAAYRAKKKAEREAAKKAALEQVSL